MRPKMCAYDFLEENLNRRCLLCSASKLNSTFSPKIMKRKKTIVHHKQGRERERVRERERERERKKEKERERKKERGRTTNNK